MWTRWGCTFLRHVVSSRCFFCPPVTHHLHPGHQFLPTFPILLVQPIGWPLRMGPPPGPAPPNFFRPPAPLPFPLSDFSGFAPIGFEYPSQEELLQMEREKKQRKERLKAEKSKSIGKRVEDQRYATTTTESNDQRTSTESYSTAANSFEEKTKFDDSKSAVKLTEYDKMKEDRIKSFYRPGDLKDKSESKHEESKRPLDVKRKQTVSPNGQVTFITEMLYDIEGGNPFKPTTSPPSASSPYLPPTTDGMYNPDWWSSSHDPDCSSIHNLPARNDSTTRRIEWRSVASDAYSTNPVQIEQQQTATVCGTRWLEKSFSSSSDRISSTSRSP